MGLIYKEEITMPFDLCDVKHDAKIPLFLAYCLSMSAKQTNSLGRSDEYILQTYNLVWIITDYEMSFERLPKFFETITIETEPISYNKFFCYREFRIFDQKGNQIATIMTHFALMDPDTRKVSAIPEDLVAPYQSEFVKKMRRVPKIHRLEEQIEKQYHVRYYDIDMNGHVNNGKYMEWIYDVLGFEFLNQHRPKSIQLKYIKEVSPGGTITSAYQLEDLVSKHEIISEGDLNAQAIIEWAKIEA